jgi:hypothetical protein
MFDLDRSIAEWRQQMIAGGINSPPVLDELESHLRDDFAEQLRAGSAEPPAFEIAVQRLGQAAVLEGEFEKVGATRQAAGRVKHAFLTFAGIPSHYFSEPMNTQNIEPRWATYLKGSAFLTPALLLWGMSVVFVIPKLQLICATAGGPPLPAVVRLMIALTQSGLFILGGVVLVLGLLEWRSSHWPRYRRAVVGLGTFLLNAVILISIFMMVVAALLAAPALMHGR